VIINSSRNTSKKNQPEVGDTIAAISTPFGESGIGIVRISGRLSETIAKKIFKRKRNPTSFVSHKFYLGEIVNPENETALDEVLLVLMKSPKTYTREDIVEIHCHGGYFILQRVLEIVLNEGARMAEPGEFTKRAFLNGRIDLTQAEAVIDLIKAKTTAGIEVAKHQLSGRLSRELFGIREELIERLVLLEAHIDFPEEEIGEISLSEIKRNLFEIMRDLDDWIGSYEEGKILKDGVSLAIIGKTNVGKSSLLNALLKENRAIVAAIPGTTRDVIEEVMNINGIAIRLKDTAGFRETSDSVEQEGVRRARKSAEEADFILLMVDGSQKMGEDDELIFREVESKKKIIIINKNDLTLKVSLGELKELFPKDLVVSISCRENKGIDELKETIYRSLIHRDVRNTAEYLIVSNIRHKNALIEVRKNLSKGLEGLEKRESYEFIAFEIRSALNEIGELAGEATSDEILNRIFDQFCIGK
jgi:tRNA modification GTPase